MSQSDKSSCRWNHTKYRVDTSRVQRRTRCPDFQLDESKSGRWLTTTKSSMEFVSEKNEQEVLPGNSLGRPFCHYLLHSTRRVPVILPTSSTLTEGRNEKDVQWTGTTGTTPRSHTRDQWWLRTYWLTSRMGFGTQIATGLVRKDIYVVKRETQFTKTRIIKYQITDFITKL